MYKKILVVVDDRVVTQSAIRQAIEIAHSLGANIHFFYFLPAQSLAGYASPPAGEQSSHDAQGSSTMHARNMLVAASELAERAGVQNDRATGCGADGAHCVADAAEKSHCDLIVVGVNLKNPVLHTLNENIVADLISVATVPVLVCRDTGSSGGFGRRASVSIRARQRRLELMERRKKEKND